MAELKDFLAIKRMEKKQLDDMVQMGGKDYAVQEAWDIQAAAMALAQIASMVQGEEDEPQDVKALADIMRALLEFINGELDEMQKAARRGDAYEKTATQTDAPVYAQVKSPALNLSYAKSLGVDLGQKLAVKYTAKNEIKGYTFLWGNPKLTDVEIEYFTKDTNFWDDVLGKNPRPLTWDHAQDKTLKASPIIGRITDFGDDEIGRWYVAKLDTSHRYRAAIDALIEDGVLGTSSDSAPQYVTREKTGKATWLKEWAWFASALTDTPAEPRMMGSLEYLKSLGILLPDTRQAWEWNQKRLNILKLK